MFPKISINLRIIAVKESSLPLYKTTKMRLSETKLELALVPCEREHFI